MKRILDACCGFRCLWYDKHNAYTVYMDNRVVDKYLLAGTHPFEVQPDIVADFRKIPFPDSSFRVVVFDPPHLNRAGTGWLSQKYGCLPHDWQLYIAQGFQECFRVLEPFGVLCFKWSDPQIPFTEVIKLAPEPPLFGDRGRQHTKWTMFIKGAGDKGLQLDLFDETAEAVEL